MKVWFLEGFLGPRRSLQRIRLAAFPFRIGRQDGLSLVLDSPGISREHAEIQRQGDELVLCDLNSTNGCFHNRDRISGTQPLRSGDILHFADEEFRLVAEDKPTGVDLKMTQQGIMELSENMPSGSREFQQMLLNQQVRAVFQPIVETDGHAIYAYEILGRGAHPDLAESPGELFRIAESLNLDVQLSELFRTVGMANADMAGDGGLFFTNIHPAEIKDVDRLLTSMDRLQQEYSSVTAVLEIHEQAVANREVLQIIRDRLRESEIHLAYDDLGRGQARMLELAEVPPDYVKLDMALVKDIDLASRSKQDLVKLLVSFAHNNDIKVIAEGVNSDGEVAFLTDLAVDLLQGYRFGRPDVLPTNRDD